MRKSPRVFINMRTGEHFFARTVKELRSQIGNGGSRVHKMYMDTADGTYHTGYVIGRHWLEMYKPDWRKV